MEVLVLDTNMQSVYILDSYKSLIWTDRFNIRGDFELVIPISEEVLRYVREDYYLWIKESEHCMIVELIRINQNNEDGNELIITGRSLEFILDRRIVWTQRILTGNFQEAIRDLLNEAIISPEIPGRKIDNFIFEMSDDPKITALKIDTQFTGDNLYTVVESLCTQNKIGFKIILNASNQFVFSLYAGKDRSYAQTENPYVVFSPTFENILNSNYYSSKVNLRTVTLVAGEGEGIDRRTSVVVASEDSGLNRRELFTDARDISSNVEDGTLDDAEYIALLDSRGNEKLAEHKALTAFEGEVEAYRLFKYGEDFNIGDIVQIANEYGHEGSAYISELIISQSDEGLSIYPTFQSINEGEVDII